MAQAQISPTDFDKLHRYYQKHPEEYVTDVLGAHPWEKQVEIIRSTFDYKITAVKTCNAVGKSHVAARIVVTYLMLYPNSIVVTTAPTWRQVTDVLWREIGTTVKHAKQNGFQLTDKEVTQAGLNLGTNWYAVGLSTKRPENFFGYHADNILVVVDEAGGVEEPIYKGVMAITPNVNAHVLLIGNPTNPSGTFYNYFTKPELGANCFTISAFDSPNFTSVNIKTVEDLLTLYTPRNGIKQSEWTKRINDELDKRMDPTYRGLIHPSVVYGKYHELGVDHPNWQSLIMGEFPSQAEQALIPADLVSQAMSMSNIDQATGQTYAELSGWEIPDGPPEHGQDMARFGADNCVNFPRHGGWVEMPVVWNKIDLMESANRILKLIDPMDRSLRLNIDDTGNGGGTTDRLRQISNELVKAGHPAHQYQLVAYNFSSKEFMHDPETFHDITSELYWNLRTWFIKKRIALPNHPRLRDELIARRWWINKSGKIQVESKDEYKKRTGGKSPDFSDALALAFAGGMRRIATPDGVDFRTANEPTLRPLTAGVTQRF